MSITSLKHYKQTKDFVKKTEIVLNDLIEILAIMNKTLKDSEKYAKYIPVLEFVSFTKAKKFEVENYIISHQKVLKENRENGDSKK